MRDVTGPIARPISGATLLAGVIGDPVRHSLSPTLHNAAYAALGVDARYVAFPVEAGHVPEVLAGARSLGMLGLSVTTPHKDAAARACDQRSDVVERLGAANCIVLTSGVAVGESTDGDGLLDDLREALAFDVAGRDCAVIGAGGAGRAVALAFGDAGAATVAVTNRSPAPAARAAALAGAVGRVIGPDELGEFDLVVNATSIGLLAPAQSGQEDPGALLAARVRPGQVVVDLVYHPAHTRFLLEAEYRGAIVRNGLGMLVHQAARQVKHFTGFDAPLEVMWHAVAPPL
jgi:shikimate dehydrogenase